MGDHENDYDPGGQQIRWAFKGIEFAEKIKTEFAVFTGAEALKSCEQITISGGMSIVTDKFPIMTYKASSIVDKGNDNYEISGDFTMLGISKNIIVSLNRIEKDGKNVIIGKGDIPICEISYTARTIII